MCEILRTCVNVGGENTTQISESAIVQSGKDDAAASDSFCKEHSDFLCVETGQSYIPCEANCPHVKGQHEQVIGEGDEIDVQKHLADCEKNPGHSGIKPIYTFDFDHFPKCRRVTNSYNYLKALANLTVKVSVKMTSPHRPQFWPGTNVPYFLYHMRGSQHLRTGSGRVSGVVYHKYKSACPCQNCFNSNSFTLKWWEVDVVTAANLVFDNVEASHTIVRLFYDKDCSPVVTLSDNARVVDVNIHKDMCRLKFVTCNKKLGKKIQEHLKQFYYAEKERNKKHLFDDKFVWLVFHPHGGTKRICLGSWRYEYRVENDLKFVYSIDSCPGSSGAPIHRHGYKLNVHSGYLVTGQGYSCSM
uniref:Uncharacterized protein n=1 Tax=Biomphalaria glabrata TaxID=6526 RepID=A0A2C9KZ07_BIOGL